MLDRMEVKTTRVNRRSDLVREVEKLRNLTLSSEHFKHLIDNDVNENSLREFVADGCKRKTNFKKSSVDQYKFESDLNDLTELGGVISGGAAVAQIFKVHKTNDYDIFFNNPVNYAKAVLSARDNPCIDVCFYFDKPYELFDLALTKCAVNNYDVDIDPLCALAFKTGVSDICPESLIDGLATARRILKYNKRLGMKFKSEQIIPMCAIFKVPDDLTSEVLAVCI